VLDEAEVGDPVGESEPTIDDTTVEDTTVEDTTVEDTTDPEAAASAAAAALRRATRSTTPRRKAGNRASRSGVPSRDPQPVGQALDDLLTERGWQGDSAIARLVTRWPTVVGAEMADHVAPVSFQDGVLLLQAESTAWATQVRLLLTDLRRVVEAEVGVGVVTSISVVGPTAPSWIKGPRTVKGRGPRDTYG